jgi:hypothetical protein
MIACQQVEADLEHTCLTFAEVQEIEHIRSFACIAATVRHGAFLTGARCASTPCTRIRTSLDREASDA